MSSLDDFFAKKDRRRSATKTNLLAADELYRTLEEATKVPQELDSREEKLLPEPPVNVGQQSLEFGIRFSDETIDEEDEWCDFTEEHDQPFPNLKRNSKLVLSSASVAAIEEVKLAADNSQCQDDGGDGLGVGQSADDLAKSPCPWLKLEPNELTSSIGSDPAEEPAERKPQPNMAPKKPVYVPPALRQSQSEFSVCSRKQPPLVPVKLAKGQAPDLNNVDFFPSLCQSRISKRAK